MENYWLFLTLLVTVSIGIVAFIPIILAAIIYREKISIKKMIGIAITAVSLYFFA